jgi:signal peptidase II
LLSCNGFASCIGNLIDRVYLGHVIDYIQVWLGNYPWPAFNIADAAISVGAALLILSSFAGIGNTSTE